MVKELVRDEAILSTPCEKATEADEQIVTDLVETLESLEEVACLAANQIGETKQIVAVYDDNGNTLVLMNPVMTRALYPVKAEEECMTIDGITKVTRYGKINVSFDQIKDGKLVSRKRDFMGNTAQAIQHGIDHCKGKLI